MALYSLSRNLFKPVTPKTAQRVSSHRTIVRAVSPLGCGNVPHLKIVGVSCDMNVAKLLSGLTSRRKVGSSAVEEEIEMEPTVLRKPTVHLTKLVFSDGTSVNLGSGDVVVIVGPNNAGKSEALRGIEKKLGNSQASSPVVRGIEFERKGSVAEVMSWLRDMTNIVTDYGRANFTIFGKLAIPHGVQSSWEQTDDISQLAKFFCTLLRAEERLGAANAPDNIAITEKSPSHPIHILQWDDSLESKISEHFQKAFGSGIVVHRNAGGKVPILVGTKPTPPEGKDRLCIEYLRELEKLPRIETQGDGMRSFLGVLLFTSVGFEPILLIDEPEAFLHPPQARHLGSFLVKETDPNRQVFVATHSGDVLRGALDAENTRVRVVRLRRVGDRTIARQLDSQQISQVWSDPLLRYSNILDSLFHDRVILCEADSDCRFYSAMIDAIFDSNTGAGRKPDIMFTHCGGKDRMKLIIRSLRGLDVPISIVVDFDVLNSESPLSEIVEAAGGRWTDVKDDWKKVKSSVDEKKPELNLEEAKTRIATAFDSVKGPLLSEAAKKAIQDALKASSPWATAKSVGISFIPRGDATEAVNRLLVALEKWGIFVVPVGELEGFVRSEGNHGPLWVGNVLRKDLKNDPEFDQAKQFLGRVIG